MATRPFATNVTTSLDNAALETAVSQLIRVVDAGAAFRSAVYVNVLTVTYMAAKRLADAWARGEGKVDGKDGPDKSALSLTWSEFRMVFVDKGGTWFRESEDAVGAIRAIRNKMDRAKAVREYFKAPDKGGFSPADGSDRKAVEGPSKVSAYARKVFADAVQNHADTIKTVCGMDSPQARMNAWADFVRDTYGATLYALDATFARPAAEPAERFDAFRASLERSAAKFSLGELETLRDVLQGLINGKLDAAEAANVFALRGAEPVVEDQEDVAEAA